MKKTILLTVTLLLLTALSVPSWACTVIAVGKKASKDGSVIISHTYTGPDSRIRLVPGQLFKKGDIAAVYWGILEADRELANHGQILGYIPQAEQTYSYFHSAYSHVNEYQLGIGESTITQRKELRTSLETGKQIMTIDHAMIFALQRYKKLKMLCFLWVI